MIKKPCINYQETRERMTKCHTCGAVYVGCLQNAHTCPSTTEMEADCKEETLMNIARKHGRTEDEYY